jgi:hypothetical protein
MNDDHLAKLKYSMWKIEPQHNQHTSFVTNHKLIAQVFTNDRLYISISHSSQTNNRPSNKYITSSKNVFTVHDFHLRNSKYTKLNNFPKTTTKIKPYVPNLISEIVSRKNNSFRWESNQEPLALQTDSFTITLSRITHQVANSPFPHS